MDPPRIRRLAQGTSRLSIFLGSRPAQNIGNSQGHIRQNRMGARVFADPPDFVPGSLPISAHDAPMAGSHPFTTRIQADPLSERRFRWAICEGEQIRLRSPHSYATRREAEADAGKAMLRLAANQPERGDRTI